MLLLKDVVVGNGPLSPEIYEYLHNKGVSRFCLEQHRQEAQYNKIRGLQSKVQEAHQRLISCAKGHAPALPHWLVEEHEMQPNKPKPCVNFLNDLGELVDLRPGLELEP